MTLVKDEAFKTAFNDPQSAEYKQFVREFCDDVGTE